MHTLRRAKYRLDRLAMFRESVKVASVPSYDRTGGKNERSEAQGFDLTNIICERTG